jgi:hypothetical protein
MRATSRILLVLRRLKFDKPTPSSVKYTGTTSLANSTDGAGSARFNELFHGLPRIGVPVRELIVNDGLFTCMSTVIL